MKRENASDDFNNERPVFIKKICDNRVARKREREFSSSRQDNMDISEARIKKFFREEDALTTPSQNATIQSPNFHSTPITSNKTLISSFLPQLINKYKPSAAVPDENDIEQPLPEGNNIEQSPNTETEVVIKEEKQEISTWMQQLITQIRNKDVKQTTAVTSVKTAPQRRLNTLKSNLEAKAVAQSNFLEDLGRKYSEKEARNLKMIDEVTLSLNRAKKVEPESFHCIKNVKDLDKVSI